MKSIKSTKIQKSKKKKKKSKKKNLSIRIKDRIYIDFIQLIIIPGLL